MSSTPAGSEPSQADAPAGGSEPTRTISIRWIVTLAAIALLLVSMVGVGTIGERHTRKVLTFEIETRISVMARNLAALGSSALFTDFPELTLHPIMRRMQDQHPELALVVVVDHENRIKGHVDARVIGSEFISPENLRPRQTRLECGPTEAMLENPSLLVAEAGIVHATGGTLGKALVAIPKSYIDKAVTQARVQQIIVISAILVVGIALAMILMSVLLRPIDVLVEGIKRIGRGDLDNPIDLRDRTEFGLLASRLNSMVLELKSVHLRGSLECFPPATLFQMMALGQFDGRLTLRVRDGVCLVYFQGGRIVFAQGLTNARLGDELVNRGRIDPAARDAALKEWKRQRGTKRLGTILVESGLITREELEEHVQDRIKDSVYEIMKWTEGRFNFENGVMPTDEDILLDDNVESLLLQCMTRLDHAELERAEAAEAAQA